MVKKKAKTLVNHPTFRKYFRVIGIIILVLAVLQAIFYFGSDLMLRSYLKEKIKDASEDKYEIDFERFHILFLQRGVTFKGLKINPVPGAFENLENTPYYNALAPEITLTGLNYHFRSREIILGNLEVISPVIDFKLIREGEEIKLQTESPLEVLQKEIRKSFLGSRINDIRIHNLRVINGDLLLQNFIAQKAIQAENAEFYVKDVQLIQNRTPATPFNAEGFVLHLEAFRVLLADSIHTVSAETIEVSSLEQFIKAHQVSISPDKSKPTSTYFQVNLDDLELVGADINKVFYTSRVEIGELKLQRPNFDVIVGQNLERELEMEDFDLYNLIEGILQSVSIANLDIEKGKFVQRAMSNPDEFRIRSEEINFKMDGFYVGPENEKRLNQFFYADNAAMELHKLELALADNIHFITGDFVFLSSYEDEIKVDNFRLFPMDEPETEGKSTLLDIQVPELMISNAHLKRIYNEGVFDIDNIVIDQPEILLKDVQARNPGDPKSFDLRDIYSEYLNGIYVKRFEIREGSLVLDNKLRERQDSLSFGRVNLILENFALDEGTEESDSKSFFWAENLQLDLEDYALKLADNLHVFKADRLLVNTKTSRIQIDGFSIRPFNQAQIQATLDRYDKKTTLDIYVPRFTASRVDIRKAYFDGQLQVGQITVPSPKINLIQHRPSTPDDELGDKVDQQEILELLTNYFSEVTVDSLVLSKGTLNYENYVRDRIRTFSEDNVSIAVKNFHIDTNSDPEQLKFLFSEEVDLSLNNYVFNIADGKYNILADRINFNTSKDEISATNVRLNPRRNFTDKTRVTARIPLMSFQGIDLEAFLFENSFSLEMIKLTNSTVDILINKDLDELDESPVRPRRDRNLPKTIELVSIDTIRADNAQFTLSIRENNSTRELINTGIDLLFYDFILDSARVSEGQIANLFGGMSAGIDEFWLTLNDSIHQVTFSKVELDTRYEGIMVNNFRVIPKNLSGKPGSPVFSGHIPTILIKTKGLTTIQSERDLRFSDVRLFRPDIEIFSDTVKRSSSKATQLDEIEKTILETLQIDAFEVVEGNFALFDKYSGEAPQIIENVNFDLADIMLDLEVIQGIDRKDLLKKDFNLTIPNYEFLLKDSLNKVTVGLITLTNNEILLDNILFEPRYGRYEYTRRKGTQADVATISIPKIRIAKPDLNELVENENLIAESIWIADLKGDLFKDKRFEKPEERYKPMPQVLMKAAGFNVSIDTLRLTNGSINYMEFPDKGMVPGDISFTDMDVVLYPLILSKDESSQYPVDSVNLGGSFRLNGKPKFVVGGVLGFSKPYPITLHARAEGFDLALINSILESNAFIHVRSGQVKEAEWSFIADDKDAFGAMKILYNDLNLELLDERTLRKGKGRKAILTFVLNVFAVKSHNPRKLFGHTVTSRIYEPRDDKRFVFNYLWQSTLSGLKGSLGLGQPQRPKSLLKRPKASDDSQSTPQK